MSIELTDFEFEYGIAVKIAVASEKGRSFKLENKSEFIIKRWAIDKIVFKNSDEERCDYLIEVSNNEGLIYYWIELKGKDIIKACRQILNAIRLISISEAAIQYARIVATGVNKLAIRSIDYLRLDTLMRQTGGNLKTYTNFGVEKI
jgi:hypothetical protein